MNARVKFLIYIIITFLFLTGSVLSQNIPIYEILGKSTDYVLKTFGKPKKSDKSNPNMECLFYRKANRRMVFVANHGTVFQAQVHLSYKSKKTADSEFKKLCKDCEKNGFSKSKIDNNTILYKRSGAKLKVTMFFNPSKKKYEISLEAQKWGEAVG